MTVTHKKNLNRPAIYYAFFISGVLNIILILGLVYLYYFQEPAFTSQLSKDSKVSVRYALLTPSMEAVLREYANLSFEALRAQVNESAHVEQGFCRADLALAMLERFHHVDLSRALPGQELEKRTYAFTLEEGGQAIELSLRPGIKGEKLARVQQFLKEEAHPFTPRGLFEKIAAVGTEKAPEMVQNFTMSRPFGALHLALSKARMPVPKEVLVTLVFEGDWELFDRYSDLALHHNAQFLNQVGPMLQSYVAQGSSMACYLAILLEKEYVLKQFDDALLVKLLNTIEAKNPEMKAFLKDVIISMRCEQIRNIASSKLTSKEVGAVALVTNVEQKPVSLYTEHLIKGGETLWGISRKYGIGVEEIKEANSLTSSVLIPGKTLKIPNK